MLWRVFALSAAIAVAATVSPPATPDGQEDICNNAEVFFCDNFEARAIGQLDFQRATFKNRGWGVGNFDNLITVINDPANIFSGNRAVQFLYPAGGGGIDFLDVLFGASYRTIYARWYTRWSSNYVFSPFATKHVSTTSDGGGQSHYLFWSDGDGATSREVIQHYAQNADIIFGANQNGTFQPERNRWYCLEVRITHNSSGTSSDGYFQGWVDGVQHWEYPNVRNDPRMPNLMNGFLLSGYWNCAGGNTPPNCTNLLDQHPLMYRWHDNFVMSTQRVGCLADGPPAPPAGLRILR